jgi:hypothetical protein
LRLAQLLLHEWYARLCETIPRRRDWSAGEIASWSRRNGEHYRQFVGVNHEIRHRVRAALETLAYDGRSGTETIVKLAQEGHDWNGLLSSERARCADVSPLTLLGTWRAGPTAGPQGADNFNAGA